MILIYWVSSTPAEDLPQFSWGDLIVKKGGHLIGYALLAYYYLYGIGRQSSKTRLIAWILTIVFATSDEYHQTLVSGRYGSIWDVGIDGVGAWLGILYTKLKQDHLLRKL